MLCCAVCCACCGWGADQANSQLIVITHDEMVGAVLLWAASCCHARTGGAPACCQPRLRRCTALLLLLQALAAQPSLRPASALRRPQFARLIGTREHAEHLWRITKDEAQRSLVTQEDIVE